METTAFTPEFTAKELTENSLRLASRVWIEYRDRSERAGGYDGALLLKRNQAMNRLDHLLGQLFEQMTTEALAEIPDGTPA